MALTTRNPSPSSPMFKSEMSTSYGLVLISNSASGTLSDTRTSKPASCRTGGSVSRMLGSSSTNRTRGRFCPSAMETSPHAKLTAVRRDNHTRDVAKGKWRPLRQDVEPRVPDSAYPLKPTHLYTVFTVGLRQHICSSSPRNPDVNVS